MMESPTSFERSPQSSPPSLTSRPLANLIGTAIALLTLTLPALLILHFSNSAEAMPRILHGRPHSHLFWK